MCTGHFLRQTAASDRQLILAQQWWRRSQSFTSIKLKLDPESEQKNWEGTRKVSQELLSVRAENCLLLQFRERSCLSQDIWEICSKRHQTIPSATTCMQRNWPRDQLERAGKRTHTSPHTGEHRSDVRTFDWATANSGLQTGGDEGKLRWRADSLSGELKTSYALPFTVKTVYKETS